MNDTTRATLDRRAAAEAAFVGSEFLAAVLRGHGVGVRIAGVRCQIAVGPADFEGFGLFRADARDRATLVRPMTMGQRRRYLALFPAVRMILARRERNEWQGLPASRADGRFAVEGLAPIRFVDEGDLFDTVVARFDGGQFWFDSADGRADPAASAMLRKALGDMTEPAKVARPGLTPERRGAYAINYAARASEMAKDERARAETRLRLALEHAGAELRDYSEQSDVYRVTYHVDGRRHTSVVRKGDLSVVTAGICLSGGDRHFDLASLVGVLREGETQGSIVRVH
jgi:hypothetical protein